MSRMSLVFVCALLGVSAAAQAADLDLGWLTGRWCATTEGGYTEESWGPAQGNLMLGTSKTVSSGGRVAFEFIRIEIDGATARYFAQPGGDPATRFDLVTATANAVLFANEAHDFPRRIGYRRDGPVLHAWIDDGTDDGQSLRWQWRECES